MPVSTYTETWQTPDLPGSVARTVTAPAPTGSTSPPTTGQLWPRTKAS